MQIVYKPFWVEKSSVVPDEVDFTTSTRPLKIPPLLALSI